MTTFHILGIFSIALNGFLAWYVIKILRKFITEQGKIIPGHVTGVCSKHQRHLGKAIKQARNIALLPYSMDPRHF